jgi:glutaredoxin
VRREATVRLVAAFFVGLIFLGLSGLTSGCKQRSAQASSGTEAPPSIVVRAETEGMLLTWIDDKGDFHVETRVADVPMMGRDAVRVAEPEKSSADGDRIYVVDLRQPRADGTYPVRAMPRAEFEALAVARREKSGPTLANAGASPSAGPDPSASSSAQAAPRPLVIIYGAEWCGACHEAARYLKKKGIPFVEKDVEKDAGAEHEMEQKLAKNGLRGGSIPIIDVRGKVMVGFNAEAIDSALGQAM